MSTEAIGNLPARAGRAGYLYGPVLDFALLGGGSVLALAAIVYLLRGDPSARDTSLAITFALANLVNHPHFAHSYQIFYRGFTRKLTAYPASLRWRYLAAGVLVPVGLALVLYMPIHLGSPRALGLCVNLMFFFVGWHYVKQGYGMAMVDAVLKRAFYDDDEKKALLHNAYAVWICAWLLGNMAVLREKSFHGIPYSALPIPAWCTAVALAVAAVTTLHVAHVLYRRRRSGRPVALNGLLAYAVTLYAWLLFFHPIVLLWVPLFHSLQYMAVVWRYRINRTRHEASGISPAVRHLCFAATAVVLGYIGFWMLPQWLDRTVDYDRVAFGSSLFLFLFWIFINIHHYFLDSVMWRKGNPDVQEFLFDAGR